MFFREFERSDRAIECYERSLKICEKIYGPEHFHITIRLNNLGVALQESGQPVEAIKYLKRAYEIALKHPSMGKDHPYTKIFKEHLELTNAKIIRVPHLKPDSTQREHIEFPTMEEYQQKKKNLVVL